MSDGNPTPGAPATNPSPGAPATQPIDPRVKEAQNVAAIAEAKARASKAELEHEQHKAQTETARIEAELALVKGRGEALRDLIPEPKTTALEGTISAYGDDTKFGYAAELVGYRTFEKLKSAVADQVCAEGVLVVEDQAAPGHDDSNRLGPVVLVVEEDLDTYVYGDLALVEIDAQLNAFENSLEDFSDRNERLLQPYSDSDTDEERRVRASVADPATLALLLGIAPRAIGTVADIASYFRANYGVKAREFDLSRRGLVAAVAGELRARGADVRVSGLLEINQDELSRDGSLLKRLSALQEKAIELQQTKETLSALAAGAMVTEVAQLESRLGETETDEVPEQKVKDEVLAGQNRPERQPVIAKSSTQATRTGEGDRNRAEIREKLESKVRAAQRTLDKMTAAASSTEKLLTAFNDFCTAITATEDGQQPASKLSRAVVREKLHNLEVTHLLWLDVLSSGGEAVTKTTRWPWSYGSGQVSLMGGAAIGFILATTSGKVVAADTLTEIGVLERPLFGGERGTQVNISSVEPSAGASQPRSLSGDAREVQKQ